MTSTPDFPKPVQAVALARPVPWGRPARILAGRHRAGLAALAGLTVVLLAVWAVPPLLDWGRFRGTIAAIAAARLGRPVSIGGDVTLRLLPRAVLTAADVTLPDQGDGVSATIASLRLEVAIVPLLAGRLAPRDLVLGTPVLRLPWPLPVTLAAPLRPLVPRAFAARLDNGTLLVGGARVQGINAALHSGPEVAAGFGALSPGASAQGFGAEGFAAFAGRSWRFTSALGAPDADGVSALDLSVSGQGRAARTDAQMQGTLADGVLQGRVVAGGPDLSLLLPASALAWRAEAGFVADGARIAAPSLSLSLGGSPTEGAFTLGLARPARLDGRLHTASINLDGWAHVLSARLAAGRAMLPDLRGELDLSADKAKLLGGLLGAPRATLVLDRSSLTLRDGAAVLPAGARLTLAGTISTAADGLHLAGPATLDAPSLRTTLAWLRPLAPALADALPAGVLAHATLAGTADFGPSTMSISGLAGKIDDTEITGGFGAKLGPHPHLGLGLSVTRLKLDPWLEAQWPARSPNLAGLGRAATRLDADIHLRAGSAAWRGDDVRSLVLDYQTGPDGLVVERAAFDSGIAHVTASGGVAADGTVSGGAVHVTTSGAAGLSPWLPEAWLWAAPAWAGAASLDAALSGPAHDLDVEVRADAGDLVLEADGRADPEAGRAAGTLTLRHPGAPRLLEVLGLPTAERWLGTGSLALRAQIAITPDRLAIDDFDLRAADLGLGGRLALDRSATGRPWTGVLVASRLALPEPGQPDAAWLDRLGDRDAQVDLVAAELGIGGRTVAEDVAGTVSLAHGAGLLDITRARALGGRASGQIAIDMAAGRPRAAMRANLVGADAARLVPGLPVDVTAGKADIFIDLASDGRSDWPGSLSGQAAIDLRDLALDGFDLEAAGGALAQHGAAARAGISRALSQGRTPGLSGTIFASVSHDRAALAPSELASDEGKVTISGLVDLAARSLDVRFGLAPDGVAASGLGVRMAGPWSAARAEPLAGAAAPTRRARRR